MKAKRELPSNAVGRRRLLKLASLLEKDAKNKKGIQFDLGTWGSSSEKKMKVDCGTTACAMGLAALSGTFAREGLSAKIIPYDPLFGDREYLIMPRLKTGGRRAKTEFKAATELFNISKEQAEWLFLDDAYPYGQTTGAKGERAVAKRIRDFVAGKVAP